MPRRVCIMGCPYREGETMHIFPSDPKRRAEWCRILDVKAKTKTIYICSDHFSDLSFFGNRLSKYAMPNPPTTWRKPIYKKPINQRTLDPITGIPYSILREIAKNGRNPKQKRNNIDMTEYLNVMYTDEDVAEVDVVTEDNAFLNDSEKKDATVEAPPTNTDIFEIRNNNSDELILKGRYVQTDDYLVVTYAPIRKLILQEQVDTLDAKCKEQTAYKQNLVGENVRLEMELNKNYQVARRLREMTSANSYLTEKLKQYSQEVKMLKKTLKKRKQERKKILKANKESKQIMKANSESSTLFDFFL